MSGKTLVNRRGTLFLALLIMIAVGGLIATRLIPSKSIQEKRDKAFQLRLTLGQIRQAVDLKHLASPTWSPDFSSSDTIRLELQTLANENYLRSKNLEDPTLPHYHWQLDKNYYWQGTSNLALNTSFEDMKADGSIASWVLITGTYAASTTNYLGGSQVDSYPDQNKLGKTFSVKGEALSITK